MCAARLDYILVDSEAAGLVVASHIESKLVPAGLDHAEAVTTFGNFALVSDKLPWQAAPPREGFKYKKFKDEVVQDAFLE